MQLRGPTSQGFMYADTGGKGSNADATYNLSIMYAKGLGVEQDESEELKWLERAADAGHAAAQFVLGLKFSVGRIVEQDDEAAKTWLGLAAKQGHQGAKDFLEDY